MSSGAHKRDKGVRGEREVAQLFEQAGFEVRGLEGLGDHNAFRDETGRLLAIHLEVKRQERLRVQEWLRQTVDESPAGMLPLLCFRQNRERWIACLPLDNLLELLR